ncbi:hypothetical protein NQ011_00200 [Corynebacterium phoceense]|uniref:hypothetical protein n=1 Tax=Corynebacterium phoceense TaxID=1686286 RepID=UPI00211CDE70|nr:hypothetical protein [Corynebacterium phoceense]MCQ9335142.1 hypothetical protein [Corynebacterium phoceense]
MSGQKSETAALRPDGERPGHAEAVHELAVVGVLLLQGERQVHGAVGGQALELGLSSPPKTSW